MSNTFFFLHFNAEMLSVISLICSEIQKDVRLHLFPLLLIIYKRY